MEVSDKILIGNAIKFSDELYLHKDTIDLISEINDLIKDTDNSFRNKDISDKIIQVWSFILQDSINNLKSCDFREYSHWSRKEDYRIQSRDANAINNEVTFGLDRLTNYFKEFTEFESVLYGVDGGYRDHVIHVFRVWLLGINLLNCEEDNMQMKTVDIDFEFSLGEKKVICGEEIISMWAIIALCHDLGYPLEKAEKINETVEKMYRHLGKMNIQKFSASFQQEHQFLNKFLLDFISSKIVVAGDGDLTELINNYDGFLVKSEMEDTSLFLDDKKYYTSIQAKFYTKFSKSLEYYSHGIISCSILLKSLFYFLESDFNVQEKMRLSFEDARQFFIRREMLRSIASHTCPEVYHLKANTLSFLLILCDELQEWGRPRFKEIQGEQTTIGIKKVEISTFKKDEIVFQMEYLGIIDPDNFAKKIFRRWHAILRSAVYDTKRKFTLNFKLTINNKAYEFIYKDNELKATNKPTTVTTPFSIYEVK